MNFKQIDKSPKTYVLVFETGDELAKGLSTFAEEQKLSAASFKAVGALSSARLGWYSWESKKYEPSVTLGEQVELLSLIGDIALYEGKPVVHAHAVIGRKDGTAHGGHLLEAYIRPTCEVVLTESPAHLQKYFDPESGLVLIGLAEAQKASSPRWSQRLHGVSETLQPTQAPLAANSAQNRHPWPRAESRSASRCSGYRRGPALQRQLNLSNEATPNPVM